MLIILPYFIILTLITSVIIFTKNKKYRILVVLLSIILFLFAALRGNGDGDYYTYKSYSDYILTAKDLFNDNFPMELGFRSVAYFTNILNLDSQWVIIIMNVLSSLSVFLFIYRKSNKPLLSLLIFFPWFLTMDMHSARTAIAAAFGLWAIYYYSYKNNMFKYIVFIGIASLFHKTAIILVVLPLIKVFSARTFFLMALCSYIISVFLNLQMIILNLLNIIGLSSFAEKFFYYLQSGEYGYPLSFLDPRLILMLLILFLIYSIIKYLSPENEKIFKIFCLGFIFMNIFRYNTLMAIRLSYYFYIVTIMLIPEIIPYLKKKIVINDKKIDFDLLFTGIYTIYSIGIIISFTVKYQVYNW